MRKMKSSILLIAICAFGLATTASYADLNPTPSPSPSPSASPLSLQDNMKLIGSTYKTLVTALTVPAQAQQSIASIHALIGYFNSVLTLVPTSILKLPTNQQAAAIADFKATVQKEIDNLTALEKAVTANDQTAIQNITAQIKQVKMDGHQKFDPPH